jgi:hypothetical protein
MCWAKERKRKKVKILTIYLSPFLHPVLDAVTGPSRERGRDGERGHLLLPFLM